MDGLRRAGFRDVAVSYPGPLNGGRSAINLKTATMAQPDTRIFGISSVSSDFFNTLRIPLLSGRVFADREYREPDGVNPMPVVLNATMAHDLFGNERAVGHTFELDRYIGMASLPSTAMVVGVVGDTRMGSVRGEPRPALYHARRPEYRWGTILVRVDESPGIAMERIRGVVRDVDPALPITTLRPLAEDVAEGLSEDRVLARLSAIVALRLKTTTWVWSWGAATARVAAQG
jgi:hypothetical protein